MTDSERKLLVEKCGWVLHELLVEIRSLSYGGGNEKRINDLTDQAHNIPLFMIGRDEYVLEYLRDGFLDLAKKHRPDFDPAFDRYVYILDMDEEAFDKRCRRDREFGLTPHYLNELSPDRTRNDPVT